MKTSRLLLIAGIFICLCSCSKEPVVSNDIPNDPVKLTFQTVIDWEAVAKASLNGLRVEWGADEHIGVATDVADDNIVDVTITPDALDPRKATFTIDPVAGATTYYAFYPYSGSLHFDSSTKTFSGMSVGKTSYQRGGLSKDLPLAGKTSGTSITFKPCLAVVGVSMASNSVAPSDPSYKAVDGFDFYTSYNRSSSGPKISGDYTVSLAGENPAIEATGTDVGLYLKEVVTKNTALTTDTYYFSIIPGGEVNGMSFYFFGVGDGWSGTYRFANKKTFSIDPGDYIALTSLDPVTIKQSMDSPSIAIDGDMSDWTSISPTYASDNPGSIVEWKATSDKINVYFYFKLVSSAMDHGTWGSYICTGFDTDNNTSTGSTEYNLGPGLEARSYFYPFNGSDPIAFKTGSTGSVQCPIGSSSVSLTTNGMNSGDYDYVEVSIPRSAIGFPSSGSTIYVRHNVKGSTSTATGIQGIVLQ